VKDPRIPAFTLHVENTENPGIDKLALEKALKARLAQQQAQQMDLAESL